MKYVTIYVIAGFIKGLPLKGTNTQHSGHMGQTELVAENYSKCPVRAIGKVLLMKFT